MHVPIIAMTANSMQGERERCISAGMDDYMSKPLRNRTLKEALGRWVTGPAVKPARPSSPKRLDSPRELLDTAVIAELADLNGDVLTDLVSLYFEQTDGYMTQLGEAIDCGDAPLVARTSHQLRGSSGTVGAARVSAAAAELEATAKEGDLSGAPELLARLRAVLGETGAALESYSSPVNANDR